MATRVAVISDTHLGAARAELPPGCAGLIAGGALMGIAVAVCELFIPAAGH